MTYVFLVSMMGLAAGLRTATPMAVLSWAAVLGWISLEGSWLSLLATRDVAWLLTLTVLWETFIDKLPSTRSRKVPIQFAMRVVVGAVAGEALTIPGGLWCVGIILGAFSAVAGTLGGFEARKWVVSRTGGRDLPIALLEDVLAIALALAAVWFA